MNENWKLPTLNAYIEKWAKERPDKTALIQHEDDKKVSYKEFNKMVDFFALRLLDMGIQKGDRVATMLVMVPEHIYLMYACFKIGAIIAPLDMRLQEHEVVRDLNKIKPKAFFFLGETQYKDFREVGIAVRDNCPYVENLVQFTPNPKSGDIMEGAISITEMMDKGKLIGLKLKDVFTKNLDKAYSQVEPRTPALIIFTTGTTGEPKPAMICHENIIIQNEILNRSVSSSLDRLIMLVNLPPSHVGGVTEQLMTTLYVGGTGVLLRIFDPKLSLEAIQKHKVTILGQIPTQYRMEWNLPEFSNYDLSSLQYAIYGGSAVDSAFLKELSRMAPNFGTGMGMTETAGFYTFTPPGISVEEMAGQVGSSFDDLAPVTIRETPREDGTAGDILPEGEVGEICAEGPIVFLGYYQQPQETAKTLTSDGILYTGDLGQFKDMGSYKALYLAGRKKFIIKQKGYQVFPDEVQEFIAQHPKVDQVEVIGMKHQIFDEGIVAFVRPAKGEELTAEEIMEHCKGIASYKRPQHVEIWGENDEFPLTRVAKVDKNQLKAMAEPIIEELRQQGKWDAGNKA